MLQCVLVLGEDPWRRMVDGKLSGSMCWNGDQVVPAVVGIRGAHSRRFPKRSLQVDLRRQPLVDDPPEGHTIRRLHLNADYVDPTLMRSWLSFWLFEQVGAPAPLCRHVALYLDQEFAGVYLAMESVDRDFCHRRGWKPGPIYYALNRNANFGLVSPFSKEVKQPLDAGYKLVAQADPLPLRRMIMDINLATVAEFPGMVTRHIDVVGYLRWLMVAVFVGNRDGFMHNYALYAHPVTHQFRIIPWDYDATWGIDIHGRPASLSRVPLTGWNKLTHRLLGEQRFRQLYQKMFREALDGPLAPYLIHGMIDKVSAEIAPWLNKDRNRRVTDEGVLVEVDRLRQWAVKRRALLLNQLDRL
jgi:spore coat protein H